ncbi:hypothetical protein PO883_16355 [Massilia sp. DJPM01]|uniref:hypothetical protein n=1 Tax=Massilia sp. DJPM01 TaxID=3024404 RepID=UPI00259DC571|nr:hypothetical protein [Massilia sp. DJPM01]MDM5178774.1 hypothetical protein [Massilia sp. DJPM01]
MIVTHYQAGEFGVDFGAFRHTSARDTHQNAAGAAQPDVAGGRHTRFHAGPMPRRQCAGGFFRLDLGALDAGGRLMELPFGALAMSNFVKI